MKKKGRLFLSKKILIPLLIITLIPVTFFGLVYFSPGHVRNFPVGNNTAQVNFTGGMINIFYPKNDTTFYYSHNFSSWQEITGADTKLEDLSYPKNYNDWKIKGYGDQLVSLFRGLFKPASPQQSNINVPQNPDQGLFKLPPQDKKFTSKLLDFTLTIPAENYFSSESGDNYESMVMWITPEDYARDGENKLSMTIYPISQGCNDTSLELANGPTHIKIAGKYPITLLHGSISHGESGHYYDGVSKLENGYCIAVSIRLHLKYKEEFMKILEGN